MQRHASTENLQSVGSLRCPSSASRSSGNHAAGSEGTNRHSTFGIMWSLCPGTSFNRALFESPQDGRPIIGRGPLSLIPTPESRPQASWRIASFWEVEVFACEAVQHCSHLSNKRKSPVIWTQLSGRRFFSCLIWSTAMDSWGGVSKIAVGRVGAS